MTQALALPLSLAVARIHGVSYFNNGVLTQVSAAIFQWKKKGMFGGPVLRAGTAFHINLL